MSKIYILLPVHNRKEITRGFVASLKAQTFSDYHLVLIDDGSTDGTAEMVLEYIPSATVLRGEGNWWWAGSLQQGIHWLQRNHLHQNDIILMINDDVVLDNNFIEAGRKELLSLPGTLLQATVCNDISREILDVGMVYDDSKLQFRPPRPSEKINCLTTNGLFVRWGDLLQAGDFYPRLLPHYLSDYEFTIRAGRKGLQLRVSQGLKVWWNRETTGLRQFDESDFLAFCKSYFSKKSALNPVYWTSFVLLTSQFRYIPLNLMRIWRNALVALVRHVVSASKVKFDG